MIEAGLKKAAAGHSADYLTKDFYPAFIFAALALLLHVCALAGEFSRAAGSRTLNSTTIMWLLTLMTPCLVANAVGLWVRRAAGLVVSIVALLAVGAGYITWYLYSRHLLEFLSSNPFYLQHPEAVPLHPFGLIGATWPNLVVLVMCGVLLVWEAKTLRGRLQPLG